MLVSFIVSLLIVIVVVCIFAYIVSWALGKIPGTPEALPGIIWAVAALLVLIWLLQHISELGVRI